MRLRMRMVCFDLRCTQLNQCRAAVWALSVTPQLQLLSLIQGFTSLSGGTALISFSHSLTIKCWCPAFCALVCAREQAGMLSALPVYSRLCSSSIIQHDSVLLKFPLAPLADGWLPINEGITFWERKFLLLCLSLSTSETHPHFIKSSLCSYTCTCMSRAELMSFCCTLPSRCYFLPATRNLTDIKSPFKS